MCGHDISDAGRRRGSNRGTGDESGPDRRRGNGFLEERDLGASRIEWLTDDGVCASIVRFTYIALNAGLA